MNKAGISEARVQLVAALLAGAWRPDPPAADCNAEELELIRPLLIETGAAALAWRRVSHSEPETSIAARQLHDVYRLYRLLIIVYRQEVAALFKLLRSHSIEPILVKGWAIARHYAEPGVRPCGDIDLCVRRPQHQHALELLKRRAGASHSVDLHKGFQNLDDRGFDELYARSEIVELEGEAIRVLSAEDHLRVLCYHFLREGGWRPLWLCDIAAALEARPVDFDWGLCLGASGRRALWVACAIRLAQGLLKAEVRGAPAAVREAKLPSWLVPGILKEWEVRSMSQRHRAPIYAALSRPLSTLKWVRYHWPSPVEATVTLGGPFNELPRLPFQIGDCLSRTARFIAHLPRQLRNAG
jgi:hypothetical protein